MASAFWYHRSERRGKWQERNSSSGDRGVSINKSDVAVQREVIADEAVDRNKCGMAPASATPREDTVSSDHSCKLTT